MFAERTSMQFDAQDIEELANILADKSITMSFSTLNTQQVALAVVKYVLCKELQNTRKQHDTAKK